MKRWTWLVPIALAVAGLSSCAWGQFMTAPGAENCLTVTLVGSASAPAEWAEVNLYVSASGATASAALMAQQDARDRTLAALAKFGIKREDVRLGPPRIVSSDTQPWMQAPQGGGPVMKFQAVASITVRLAKVDPQTIYGDVCEVIDTAATGGAGARPPTGVMDMVGLTGGGQLVTFGVTDPGALRSAALANGLQEAKAAAAVAATAAGKTVGDLASLQILPEGRGTSGLITQLMGMGGGETTQPAHATLSVMMAVTFKLK